jgi:hypothetical protein
MATANTIIRGAYQLIGVVGKGDPLGPDDAQDGLRRLNNMAASWITQSLTSLAVQKQIFNLTSGQQTYSIGLGGDFNVNRPQQINGAGLILNGMSAAQSVTITRSGTTATVTLAAHGLTVGQEVFIYGCDQTAYNQTQVVVSVPTANTFTYTVFGAPTTPATGAPTVQTFTDSYVEIPRTVITDTAFEAIQIKNLSNAQFTNVYYNPLQPLGQIFLWPAPNTAINALVLYLQTQFDGFANLTTDYTFPDVPGYAEALEYNLAIRLAAPNGVRLGEIPEVVELARTSLGLIKRENYKLFDLPIDPALTANVRGGYNINTDQS